MLNRKMSETPANLFFTITGIKLLRYFVQMRSKWQRKNVVILPLWFARIGDYLNRTKDTPLGDMVFWRGMARFTDIHIGLALRAF
jgi:hypothetical protein